MVQLDFSLTPEACARLHDALICMKNFSDVVALEARQERLTLSALNLAKSGYASFVLQGPEFFDSYNFTPAPAAGDNGRFTCEITSKALLSVFKGRLFDPRKGDTAIDRCEVSLQDRPNQAQCRLIIKMICDQGVTKTYRLTYESVEVMHALFDKQNANNRWSIKSSYLREFIDYFGPKTEHLDFCFEDHQVTFTSFTEKIVNANREILKHPLQTAVTLNAADFDELSAQAQLHITISVKDFKAIVSHAETLRCQFNAFFSRPGRPLQFQYGSGGMECSFTLMTIQDGRTAPAPVPANTHQMQTRTAKKPEKAPAVQERANTAKKASAQMPPPPVPNTRKTLGRAGTSGTATPSQGVQQRNLDPDSLFVQQDEEDHQWDPANLDEGETLGWDASADNDAFQPGFKDTATPARTASYEAPGPDALEPTQRMSQIKGLW
ncbi:hypothetical protein NA57DRAFT_77475 [Rhizodiscina lignyota]|uniref:DNA repair protein rad9 n=1 Tax=Rhizodiscina lignyota TaxID=1504668 RepID=A0A9P4I8M7_9PEZI|nr:hypothetical protein NA57DRAFT_77475 [Rhizodiscina lignyota]